MRPALTEIKILEAYLSGSLPSEARMSVEIRLLWDLAFQQKIALQRQAYRALQEAGRQQLRQELKAIHARLFSS